MNIFAFLDAAQTEYQVKMKEGMNKDWEKPSLNKKFNHLATTVFLILFLLFHFLIFCIFFLILSLSPVK